MIEFNEDSENLERYKTIVFLKGTTLFTDLLDEEVERFVNAARINSYKKGKLLYREEAQADFFHVICSGWLKLYRTTQEGEEVSLVMITRNSITGESAIFEGDRYGSSAQVVEDAQILSVPLLLLKERIRLNNQLAFNMLTSLVQYQRRHELQLEQYLLCSAPQRIGRFLIGLCSGLEQKDGVTLNLPYDKMLIASALGMKGATFSRALNILREETGIHITGMRIIIDCMERLLNFVTPYHKYLP